MATKIKISIFILSAIFMASCNSDADFSGFIRSTDRVEDRVVQSLEWNEANSVTNLETTDDAYSIYVCSDAHIGETENLISFTNALNEDATGLGMVIVGDIVTGKEEDYQRFDTLYQAMQKPCFPMIGNHDLYFDNWPLFLEYFGSSTYYFTVRTTDTVDLYICLDSGNATYGKTQIEWLRNLLETERLNYRYCTVFSHTNILRTRRTTSANPMVEEVGILLDLFATHNVDLVINGHDHVQDVEHFGKTTYLITDALKDGYPNSGYIKLKVSDDELQYLFMGVD